MKFFSTTLLTATLALSAYAQQPDPANPTTPPISNEVDISESKQSIWEWDYLTGNWGGFRDTLSDKGIDIGAQYFVEVWGNTTGGLKQGTVYTGLLQMDLNVDLEKLAGWQGGSVYTRWLWLSGRDASEDLVGNFFTISNAAGFNTFRNIEMWFQQELWDDKISIRAGQLAADSEFVISDYASYFINGTFGWPAFIYTSLPEGGPGYPMGTLGARLAFNPIEDFTLLAGMFQGNVFAQDVNRHGFRWDLNADQGYTWLAEAQYRHDAWLPGQLKVGAWFSSATYANSNGSDSTYWGNYGLYFIVDQMLYREPTPVPAVSGYSKDGKSVASGKGSQKATAPELEPSNQGLGAFTRFGFQPIDRNFLGFYFDAGLTYTGLIPTRDEDTLGVALGYGQLSNGSKDVLAGEGSVNPGYEIVIEGTYQAQLTPWLVVQPDVQYIIHPGGTQDLGNAFVIGGRAVISF